MADKINSTIARQWDARFRHRHRLRMPISITLDPYILRYFDRFVGEGMMFETRSEAIEFAMHLAKRELDKKKKTWWWRAAFQKESAQDQE